MTANRKRSIDDSIDNTLRNLDSTNEAFLNEAGLLRAIQNSKQLGASDDRGSQEELKSGDSLGDFIIERKIAQGGMGVIYSAIQNPLGRQVALKTVIPTKTNEFMLARFRREREILGELHESNVVSIFAAGSEEEVEYFAMPYINGVSIKRLLTEQLIDAAAKMPLQTIVQSRVRTRNAKTGDVPVEVSSFDPVQRGQWFDAITEIMIDLANGISAIHKQGIIHRDITPNNVILDVDGRPWLIDFGIATKITNNEANDDLSPGIYKLSTDGRLGTPRYKAPELENGTASKQTDVFGLGVCFYCLLNNRDFSFDEYQSDVNSDRDSFARTVPKPMAAVCQKALNEKPELRYQTAQDLAEDLRRWRRNEPVSAMGYRLHHRFGLWLKRNPIKSIATFAAFLILAIISIAAITNSESRSRAREAELESQLSHIESTLLAGHFDEATQLISTQEDMLQISADEDPDLFLKLVRMLLRSKGVKEALQQINKARSRSVDETFLARLNLVEADVLYAIDFEESETLARKSLESGALNEHETNFAKALLATNAIEEQKYLWKVVDDDPFHLRAQQLLVANRIFLGQESRARQQLASSQSLFPNDPSLLLAEAILTQLYSKDVAIIRSGRLHITFPNVSSSDEGLNDNIATFPDWRQFDDSNKILNGIIEVFPRGKQLAASDLNVVVEEIDEFLIALHALQKQAANTGFVIFPPALYRALSSIEPMTLPTSDPLYWPRMERNLRKVANANPDMLFLFAYARSIYSRPKPNSKEWLETEKLLERALLADSIFPIRPIVIQQLALTRVQIYYFLSGKSETATRKMVESLKLLNSEGRMPQIDSSLFDNLVEASLGGGEVDLAADFCFKWRQKVELENGTSDQMANALGYSAMVGLSHNQFFNSYKWSSEAIELSPNHKYHTAHETFRNQASAKIGEFAGQVTKAEDETSKNDD